MKINVRFGCGVCGNKWKNKVDYPIKRETFWRPCPECQEVTNIDSMNWWCSPLLLLDHVMSCAGWISHLAFESDFLFRETKGLRKGQSVFDSAYHCGICFVCIVLLKVTIYPILLVGDNLRRI